MSMNMAVKCTCGLLEGVVQLQPNRPGKRLVCHCNDCQAFARYLERADEILDAHGGTDIFQISPSELELKDGVDQVACVRLTPTGMLRWYASCCRTPIANTSATPGLPVVGMINVFAHTSNSPAEVDAFQGPAKLRIYARHAGGDQSTLDAHDAMPAALIAGTMWKLLQRRLRGEHRKSPFFDQAGRPIAPAHVLSAS